MQINIKCNSLIKYRVVYTKNIPRDPDKNILPYEGNLLFDNCRIKKVRDLNTAQNSFHQFFIKLFFPAIFFLSLSLSATAKELSPNVTLSAKSLPLASIFGMIKSQTGFHFFYRTSDLQQSKPISVQLNNIPLEKALNILFEKQPLTYLIEGNTIVVSRSNKKIGINTDEASKGDIVLEVGGKVTNSAGQPLSGVSITIKNSQVGTSTNENGNFSINAKDDAILIFSYIGFVSQEISVNKRTVINVTLADEVTAMSEVVVTALGISREKKSLGYASQQISGDDVNTVNTGNVTDALSGKVAGVQVKRNSNIGGSTNIVIRGNKSLTGDNQALWVVDGIPIDNSNVNSAGQNTGSVAGYDYGNMASDINQDDIESINVLKGAAATALYGSRAANGAIIITTKNGKGKKSLITVSSSVSLGSIDKSTFPTFQQEYGSGYGSIYGPQGTGYFNVGDFDGDGILDSIVANPAYGSFGARYDPNLLVFGWNSIDPQSPSYLKKTPWIAPKNGPITFFEKPVTNINNVSIAGSEKLYNYRFSYTNYNQKGLLPNSKIKRDNLSFNSSFKVNNKLTVSGNANYIKSDVLGRNQTGGVGNGGNNPVGTLRQWWQNNADIQELKDIYFSTRRNVTNFVGGTIDNIYWQQYEIYSTDTRNRFFGNVSIKYDINDWLNFTGRVSIDNYSFLREERRNNGSKAVGQYDRLDIDFQEINYDLMLNFSKDISSKLNISGVVGTNIRRNELQSVNTKTNGGLVVDGLYSVSNSLSAPPAPIESLTNIGVNGVYGLLSLGYDNFLYLDVTGRNDQSSTLPKDNNSYFYPSISTSFIFTKFIKSDLLSFGKIRLNYANVGNAAPAHAIFDVLKKPTPFGSLQMYGVTDNKNNENLKPENTISYEGGIETRFFKNRLGFDISMYKTNTKDQILPVLISPATGYISKYVNAGEVENKGVELSLTGTPIEKDKFKWNVTLNWSKNNSKVLYLFDGVQNLVLGSRINATVGQAYGAITGRDFVYIDGKKEINQQTGEYVRTGESNKVIGNINPDWNGGIRNNFNYKNFSFGFLIDVQQGGDLYSSDMATGNRNGLYDNLVGLNDLGNPMRNTLSNGGGIILDGVDSKGNVNLIRTRMDVYSHALGSLKAPDALFIYDASYIKLREISLSYNLPSNFLNKSRIKSIKLSLTGSNVWIIHKNLPYSDPEAGISSGNVQGIQTGVLPTVREFGFDVNIQF